MDVRSRSAAEAGRLALLALALLALVYFLLAGLQVDLGNLVAAVFSVEGAAWAGVAVLAYVGYRLVAGGE
jgi:hypothetical protein